MPERSPPEIGKIVAAIWCYLRGVYTSEEESEPKKYSVKIVKKVDFT